MNFNTKHRFLIAVGIIAMLAGCASDDDVPRTSKVVLSIGDTITPLNDLQYQLPIVVQVAGLDGKAISDATVSISVKTTEFFKGYYVEADTTIPADGTPDELVQNILATCVAEDINSNGILDGDEDINGNLLLEPNIPSVTSHLEETPTLIAGTQELVTDDNGFGYFSITYPKSEATWVNVELTASVSNGLPENRSLQTFRLLVLKEDLETLGVFHPFGSSPYGVSADCASSA